MKLRLCVVLCVLVMCVNPLSADSFTLDLGTTGGSMMGRLIQLLIMMTVLTLAPSIVMMVTSFTRIVVVFSFLYFNFIIIMIAMIRIMLLMTMIVVMVIHINTTNCVSSDKVQRAMLHLKS